jgi:sulfite reductase alpha subunit-like flavoprotein
VQYSTGDHIAILARNRYLNLFNAKHSTSHESFSPVLVKQLAARIGVALDEEFTLHADAAVGTLETPFPCPTTVSRALTCYLDINGSVSKTLLRRLGHLANDEAERTELLQARAADDFNVDYFQHVYAAFS